MNKLILILITALTFVGCTKDGKDGAIGPAGANGTNGNANVMSTTNFNATSGNWAPYGSYYYVDLIVPDIDANIVNSGTVFVYVQSGTGWIALPYTFGVLSRIYQFSLNQVRIFYQNTDGTQTTNPGNKTFRIVVIPSSNRIIGLDYNDYNAVKDAYNLEN